jgi:hypothetical protein
MITKLLHEHEGELHKEEIDYITNFTFTESYFYGLPKVHTSQHSGLSIMSIKWLNRE